MAKDVILPGKQVDFSEISSVVDEELREILPIVPKGATSVEAARGDADFVSVDKVEDTDIVEIELEDGLRLWLSVEQAERDFGSAVSRSGRDAGLLIPRELSFPHRRQRERGAVGWAVKGLKIFGFDPVGDAAEKSAIELAKAIEDKNTPGFFQCKRSAQNGSAVIDLSPIAAEIPTDKPILVFLHGTFSSTNGSYGDLVGNAPDSLWTELNQTYGGHVYALEHRTVTQSPLQNAIDLLNALPAGAKLHLVSFSRGGLVGEIICRAARVTAGSTVFDDDDFKILQRDEATTDRSRSQDIAHLEELNTLIAEKKPIVERFVRVACPAGGTTLASKRVDRYLSVALNAAGLVPGLQGNPAFDIMKAFLFAFIKTRADPDVLPGLEAQMPSSPLIAILNRPRLCVDGRLAVISGDIEGTGVLKRLAVLATDMFFPDDHDLVVDTSSMTAGATRKGWQAEFFDQGSEVSHFGYFRNAATRRALMSALAAEAQIPPSFRKVDADEDNELRFPALGARADVDLPVAFILPGILGSHLEQDSKRIWLSLREIPFGGLDDIRFGEPDVRSQSPMARYYGDLARFLSKTHNVVPFHYDWRLSITEQGHDTNGDRLADAVASKLSETDKPIRFVAHSMGGLIVRSMIAQRADLWSQIKARDGSRFVMLGTPNGGSFSMVNTLIGRSGAMKKLALVDLVHDMEDLVEIIGGMPGALELLPADEDGRFLTEHFWNQLHAVHGKDWVEPPSDKLAIARKTRQMLDDQTLDADLTCYVAGIGEDTPAGIEIDPTARGRKKIKILATDEGDGTVTWETGRPAGIPTWFMNAEHGDLPRHEPGFPAILDLLESGTTSRLSQQTPRAARGAAGRYERPDDRVEVYPSEDDLMDSWMGGGRRSAMRHEPLEKAHVTIAHGNLKFARYPVAVGHYLNDPMMGAEAALDRCLEGRLSKIRDLGLYPGDHETHEIVLDATKKPSGAIVVGLGLYGELQPGQLEKNIRQAILRYGLVNAATTETKEPENSHPSGPGVSVLLIGHAGATAIAVRDSVEATLKGIAEANKALGALGIRHVQFIELYHDTAIEAAGALNRLASHPKLRQAFEIDPEIIPLSGRRTRYEFEKPSDWWQRILISPSVSQKGALEFVAITETARANATLSVPQRALVDKLVERAQANTAANRDIGRLLFELLVPSELKPYATEQRRLLIVLDEHAAVYPWEMLEGNAQSFDPRQTSMRGRLEDERQSVPLAVKAPVIRQLKQSGTAATAPPASEDCALVVGDPISNFQELPAAQREAKHVQAILEDNQYRVQPLHRPSDGLPVISHLMLSPWKIIHLAGHGVFEYGPDKVTGMVIGDDQYLTPSQIDQLGYVPEFVFINCCHLGRAEAAAQEGVSRHRSRLAANLAIAFIRRGVKAVIAAGWAVDDAAADVFANTFYKTMFTGENFATAVHRARQQTFNHHASVDTWGAYQCYGDPDYRFLSRSRASGTNRRPRHYYAVEQAIIVADNIVESAGSAHVKRSGLLQQLKDLEYAVPDSWRSNSRLLAAFARAFAQIDEFDTAIDYYEKAIRQNKAGAAIASLEQLANLRVRKKIADFKRKQPDDDDPTFKECEKVINDAIENFKALDTLTGTVTSERTCLIGSAYKRLAQIESHASSRRATLRKMETAYREARDKTSNAATGTIDPYCTMNWITAVILGNRGVEDNGSVSGWLDAIEAASAAADDAEPTFWNLVMVPEVNILRAIADPEADRDKLRAEVISGLKKAWLRGGSYRQARSTLEQMDFIMDVLPARDSRKPWLQEIRDFFEDLTSMD